MNGISTNGLWIGLLLLVKVSFAQEAFTEAVLKDPNNHKPFYDSLLTMAEVPVYHYEAEPKTVLLENGYAKYTFQNPQDWPPQGDDVIPTYVKVVFTKYPKDRTFWLTDYQWLLSKRLQALFELDARFNDPNIQFSMVLQTDCENEFEAMQLFHGIEVGYRPLKADLAPMPNIDLEAEFDFSTYTNAAQNAESIKKLKRMMYHDQFSTDSTVFKALSRNNWQNSTLVIDWTQSVYGFGAEAILWHSLFQNISGVERVIFFNDGNRQKDKKKIMGYTGGIYIEKADDVEKLVKRMKRVKWRGNGGDSPENDMEALIVGSTRLTTENLILIADNRSCIRDYVMMRYVKRPVHVVLGNVKKDVNPQYVNLAWRTGGSLSVGDTTLYHLDELVANDALIVNGIKYTLTRKNQLQPVSRRFNSFKYCNRYYSFPRSKSKKHTKRRKDPKCYFTN